MAKSPGDGTPQDGMIQINVRLNANLYRQLCSVANAPRNDGQRNSLSKVVRDSIVSYLDERN